jgi:alpha-mannosidase
MKFEQLVILLPCHSLEDFPLHHQGDEASGLLAAWTALWHPALLAACGKMPTWARADDPPAELQGRLVVIPGVSDSLLLAGWPARAKNEGACVVRRLSDRQEIAARALSELDEGVKPIPDEQVAEFYALGYAYLQEELLTRRMRYMSNLDEVHFESEAVRAAQAVVRGDYSAADEHLQHCYDVLNEARQRFYPVDAYLIDLTLVAPTTLGAPLRAELSRGLPTSVLLCGQTLQHMAQYDPESLAALRAAWESGQVAVVGGEYGERELPLLPAEAALAELRRGAACYRQLLGQPVDLYGRRRFGLTPLLPQLLARSGFVGALHLTLDDGRFPRDPQAKIRWEGIDHSGIDALTRIPLDVTLPESFLSFCEKMGETMDLDQVATLVLAHWPGQTSPWFEDLRRIVRRSGVLGKMIHLREYFTQTSSPASVTLFDADQYRSPYLKQHIIRRQANPVSRFQREHRWRRMAGDAQALRTLAVLLGQPSAGSTDWETQLQGDESPELQTALQSEWEAAGRACAACLRAEPSEAGGILVLNPQLFPRRVGIDIASLAALPDVNDPVKAVQDQPRRVAVVDMPPMGYAWIGPGSATSDAPKAPRRGREVPLGDADTLCVRNEFCEIYIDPETGKIAALRDYKHRKARLSQEIALRQPGPRPKPGDAWRDPDEMAVYSVMAADSVEVTSTGPALGEIVSRGRLLDREGNPLAAFQQRVQVWRSSRIVRLDIRLQPQVEPRPDPWNSYYCVRFAWADTAASIDRGVWDTRQPTELSRLEAPYFVDIRGASQRTTLLTGGLPYHRKVGSNKLETLLVVRGEQQTDFRLGIGIDLPLAMPAAYDLLNDVLVLPHRGPPAGPSTGWLFHMDARGIAATHWEPLLDEAGRPVGYRVRLLETEGRNVRGKLRSFRKPSRARQVDFRGETLAQLPVEDDAVVVDFAKYEWVCVEAWW